MIAENRSIRRRVAGYGKRNQINRSQVQEKSEKFSEFSERTEGLALKCGIRVSDLPDRIGISASMFHAYRSGKQPISDKVWRKLERAEQEAMNSDKGLKSEKSKISHSESTRKIPVVGWAHAGEPANYDEIPESWQDTVPTECRDPKAFAVRLEGDSMEPRYSEGDLLIVQPSEEIYNGCLAVIKIRSDGYLFRRIEIRKDFLRLIPLNSQWMAEELPTSEIAWAYPLYGMWRQVWKK